VVVLDNVIKSGTAAKVAHPLKRIMLLRRPIRSERAPNTGCISMKAISTAVMIELTVLASIFTLLTRNFLHVRRECIEIEGAAGGKCENDQERALVMQGMACSFLIGSHCGSRGVVSPRSLQETASAETMHNEEAGSLSGPPLHHKRAAPDRSRIYHRRLPLFLYIPTYMQKFLVNSVNMDAKTVSSIMTAY